jgi:hypothetical protein
MDAPLSRSPGGGSPLAGGVWLTAHGWRLDAGLLAVPAWVIVALGVFVLAAVVASLVLILRPSRPEERRS